MECLHALAPPENLPLGEHVPRIITAQLERVLDPCENETMRQSATRRPHAPELLVGAPPVEEHLPFAEVTVEGDTMNQPSQLVAERSPECRSRTQVIEGFLPADLKLPRLSEALGDSRL